jgi:hypothetical protein
MGRVADKVALVTGEYVRLDVTIEDQWRCRSGASVNRTTWRT